MDLSVLTGPLFRIPLLVGLVTAMVLPLLGLWLRLRGEWLAALGLGHLGGAGFLAGHAAGLPVPVAGPLAAAVAAAIKTVLPRRENSAYGLMILAGWAGGLLIAANSHLGEMASHALLDGQLYFTGPEHLLGLGLLALVTAVALPWLSRRLLRARLFPAFERANGLPAWRWHFGFDLLVAAALTLATTAIGLMAAFALAFLPPWVAFRRASSWRRALIWAPAIGVLAYLAAFVLAGALDQPFGPVLVATLLVTALPGAWPRRT